MFERVRDAFKGIDSLAVDSRGAQVDGDLRLATAVVLLEMAQVDGHYSSDEGRRIFLILEKEFGLTKEKTHELLEKTEINVGGQTRLDHFIGIINSHFDTVQRQRILADAWRVIAADGETSQAEGKFAVRLREKLGLSMEQSLRARKLAEDGVDLGDTSKLIHLAGTKES